MKRHRVRDQVDVKNRILRDVLPKLSGHAGGADDDVATDVAVAEAKVRVEVVGRHILRPRDRSQKVLAGRLEARTPMYDDEGGRGEQHGIEAGDPADTDDVVHSLPNAGDEVALSLDALQQVEEVPLAVGR